MPVARSLLGRICAELRLPLPSLSGELIAALRRHRWPGNVREMRNALEHALVTAESADMLEASDLPANVAAAPCRPDGGVAAERELLLRALAAAGGKKAGAARALNCSRMTLYRRLERAGLEGVA